MGFCATLLTTVYRQCLVVAVVCGVRDPSCMKLERIVFKMRTIYDRPLEESSGTLVFGGKCVKSEQRFRDTSENKWMR